jgi:hypothetical protein
MGKIKSGAKEEHQAVKQLLQAMHELTASVEKNKNIGIDHLQRISSFLKDFLEKHNNLASGHMSPISVQTAQEIESYEYLFKEISLACDAYLKQELSDMINFVQNMKGSLEKLENILLEGQPTENNSQIKMLRKAKFKAAKNTAQNEDDYQLISEFREVYF